MILLDDVVHVLAGPALAFLGQQVILLEIANDADVGRVFVDIDHPWGDVGLPRTLGKTHATSRDKFLHLGWCVIKKGKMGARGLEPRTSRM